MAGILGAFGFSSVGAIVSAVSIAVACAATGGITYKITHEIDQAKYEKLVIADQNALATAVKASSAIQKSLDAVSQASAVAEAQAQQKTADITAAVVAKVHDYVTQAQDKRAAAPNAQSGCVTYGTVRVLDAVADGVDPSSLSLPIGKSNDDCSPIDPSALATGVANNLGVAQQNAEQLTALQNWEVQRQKAEAGTSQTDAGSKASGFPFHLP